MPPQKPLPTASDSLPDKSVTRDKLGEGAIVTNIISGSNNTSSAGPTYYDLISSTNFESIETHVRTPMPQKGKIAKFKVYISENASTTDVLFKIRKNEDDTDNMVTVPLGQTGVFQSKVIVNFLEDDLIDISLSGGDGANGVFFLWIITIEYDA